MAVRPECRRAVAQALGREPTAVEVRDMEAMMLANLRRFARDNRQQAAQMPPAQRMAEAARLTAAELVQAAQKRQQRIALAIEAQARLDSYVAGHPSSGLDALDELVAFKANRTGSVMSLETRGRAIARDAERQLVELWEATGARWFGLWENDAGLESLTRAIFGEQTTPEANRAAQAWRQVTDAMRERYNAAGGVIGRLDDWGMPHHHSSDKVARAGRDRWVADTIGRLDRARYVNEDGSLMTDAQLGTFLGEAWLSIASRGANKIEPGKFRGTGMKANRHAEERQIHFRDATAFIEYQRDYGERGLYEVMTGHIHKLARDLALIETLGPNPDATFRRALDEAQRAEATADPVNAERIDSRAQAITRLFDYVAGRSDPPANITLSRWADNLKNLLVASRLGSAIISSFSDEATIHLTAAVNGMDATQVLRNELAALNLADRTELRLARRTGLALDTMIGSLNRFGAETVTGVPSKIANAVLRVSGLNAITEARQRAFGITMMDTLGSLTREMDFAALEASDRQILKSKGITPEDWAIWQRARPEDFGNGNDHVLTPDAVALVTDADVEAVIGTNDPAAIRRARTDAMLRLLGTVQEETDMAVIVPGARDRFRMLDFVGNPRRGTLGGELWRSVLLFKSFPIAMLMRHWGRASQLGGASRAGYLATLIASTTVLGALSMQVSELLQGRDPKSMNSGKFWLGAMLKGGSLGIYGDFLFSNASQHGQSPTAALLGPSIGMLEEALNLTQGNLIEMAQGGDPQWQAEAIKFFKGITPGTNLWYTRAALDHLIFQRLQEHFSPGYLAKMKKRARKEFDQEYWWEPGKTAPRRAPDFGRAVE